MLQKNSFSPLLQVLLLSTLKFSNELFVLTFMYICVNICDFCGD